MVLLGVCALCAVAVLVALGIGSGGFSTADSPGGAFSLLAFCAWNVSPVLGLAAAVWLVDARFRLGVVVLAVGTTAFAVLLGLSLYDFLASESSTAALLFIFLPMLLWGVAVVTTVASIGVAQLRLTRSAGP